MAGKPNIRILIVDDEKDARECLETIFSTDGHSVILAKDGSEALDILLRNEKNIDLILLDYNMPNMDGYRFSEKVRTDEIYKKYSKIQIVGIGDFPENMRAYLDGIVKKEEIPRKKEEILAKYNLQ